MRRLLLLGALLLSTGVPAATLAGCGGRADDGLSKEQRDDSSRLAEIGKTSGGDWAKLSPADREFMLKMGHGNERSARMLLLGASGKLRQNPGRPGGPPRRQ